MKSIGESLSNKPSETTGESNAKLAVIASRKSEQTLAITLDSIADAVISTDLNGYIIRINPVAQKLTGWSLEEAKGHHLDEVFATVNGVNGEILKSPYASVMISGGSVKLAPNTELVARDGVHYSIEDSAAPIRDEEDSPPSGVVLVFRDVTEKRKLEIEYQQTKKLESIGRLAGGIAHDFNNLLAGILGFSEILLMELESNPRLQSYVRSIIKTSERAATLTKQLLAFSRKGKMISLSVNLHTQILSAISLLETSTDKRISINTKLNAASAMVLGDPALLESAVLNLALNARDATSVGGTISIETRISFLNDIFIKQNSLNIAAGKYLEVIISDNGDGMSDEVKSHLYEPFFTTKALGCGTGLGLAAVYGTIKEHQGAITVKSDLGFGTSFHLYFPLCDQAVLVKEVEDLKGYSGNGCILLVDDESIVRETVSLMLESVGFEVLLRLRFTNLKRSELNLLFLMS